MATILNLKEKYDKEISSKLKKELNISNVMNIPKVEKVIVNAGIGKEYRTNSKVVEEMSETIAEITGQLPVVTYAKEAISNFKLREGMPNGIKVTLRKDKMWNFLTKLVHITIPRFKDFRGIPITSFDGRGNYTLGIREHTVFPEIDPDKITRLRSLQIVVVTTAENDKDGYTLLKELGFPFEKNKTPKFLKKEVVINT